MAAVALALVGAPFLARLPLIRTRGFNPDELEHLHFSYCIAKGLVPYRDYFEHHTPWLHYLAAPLFALFDVEREPDDAFALIFVARAAMWMFAGAALALTFLLARARAGVRAASLATLLLANAAFFLSKSLEFRPDVPASALVLGALALAWRGLGAGGKARASTFVLSGALLGGAVMFTQKVLFLLPGLGAGLVLLRPRATHLGAFALGLAVPVGATLAFFGGHGGPGLFLHYNFFLNVRWPGPGAGGFLLELLREDTALAILGTSALAVSLARLRRPAVWHREGETLLGLTAASAVAGVFVLPAVTRHYFLLVLPLLAVFAGPAVVRAAERVAPGRRATALLLAVAVALSIQPLWRLRATFRRTNSGTLEAIRFVLQNSAPWETVLDGFTGLGVFRPHPGFHKFLHAHTRVMQSDAEQRAFLAGLRSGTVLPKLVFWNHYLRDGVPGATGDFLLAHYAEMDFYPVRGRLFDNGLGWWRDEAPRPLGWVPGAERQPHVFVGLGWDQPREHGRTSVRPTAGHASELLVPVQGPRPYRIVLLARADGHDAPCSVALAVNGASVGEGCAGEGWHEYAFDVRGRHFVRGLNRLRFSYPCTVQCPDRPAAPRRRTLYARSLELRRVALVEAAAR